MELRKIKIENYGIFQHFCLFAFKLFIRKTFIYTKKVEWSCLCLKPLIFSLYVCSVFDVDLWILAQSVFISIFFSFFGRLILE